MQLKSPSQRVWAATNQLPKTFVVWQVPTVYNHSFMCSIYAPLWQVGQQKEPPQWPAPELQCRCCTCLTEMSTQPNPGPVPQGPASRCCQLCWRSDHGGPWEGGREWEREGEWDEREDTNALWIIIVLLMHCILEGGLIYNRQRRKNY